MYLLGRCTRLIFIWPLIYQYGVGVTTLHVINKIIQTHVSFVLSRRIFQEADFPDWWYDHTIFKRVRWSKERLKYVLPGNLNTWRRGWDIYIKKKTNAWSQIPDIHLFSLIVFVNIFRIVFFLFLSEWFEFVWNHSMQRGL